MNRCFLCHRRIWPWQHGGWIAPSTHWHPRCQRERRQPGLSK